MIPKLIDFLPWLGGSIHVWENARIEKPDTEDSHGEHEALDHAGNVAAFGRRDKARHFSGSKRRDRRNAVGFRHADAGRNVGDGSGEDEPVAANRITAGSAVNH